MVTAPNDLLAAPDAVIPDLNGTSGEQAVQALHERLTALTNAVMDAPGFLADVLLRMRPASVCIANEAGFRALRAGGMAARQ